MLSGGEEWGKRERTGDKKLSKAVFSGRDSYQPDPSRSSGAQIAPQSWSHLEARRSAFCVSGTVGHQLRPGEKMGSLLPLAKTLPLSHPSRSTSQWRLPLALSNSPELEPILRSVDNSILLV